MNIMSDEVLNERKHIIVSLLNVENAQIYFKIFFLLPILFSPIFTVLQFFFLKKIRNYSLENETHFVMHITNYNTCHLGGAFTLF